MTQTSSILWQETVSKTPKIENKFTHIFTGTVRRCADECRSKMTTHFHWLMQRSNHTDEQRGTPHFSEMHLISPKWQKHLAVFQVIRLFLFQYGVSLLNCLRLTKLVSAPAWYPPSNSSSCADLHLQQSIMSDVSTDDNVFLWTITDQISQHRYLVSAPDRSLWGMWWTNWHGVPVSVLFQQCSFWLHLVPECRVGPLLRYSVTLAEDIT